MMSYQTLYDKQDSAILIRSITSKGFPDGTSGKEYYGQHRKHKRCWLHLWIRKIPWRRAWQLTPIFLLKESHEQWSYSPLLVGYSSLGCKQLDTTEETQHAPMHNWQTELIKNGSHLQWAALKRDKAAADTILRSQREASNFVKICL